jgi:hypothetical protein
MSGVDAPAPWRIAFDNARDPYTARNALGAEKIGGGGGGGGGAPDNAEYIVAATDATLTAERVLTNTASITWDFTTPGQAKANTAGGGGNVSNVGTPTLGQYAKWTTATTIQGVSAATVLGDIGAQPADATLTALAAYNTNGLLTQTAPDTFTGRTLTGPAAGITVSNGNGVAGNPTLALADDLAALEGLTGTSTIYYRSGTSAWTAVTIGTGLTFTAGTLDRAALTGDVTASGGSNATTIANDAVTYAKMQNVSAASLLIGRGSAAGAGDPQEITLGTNLSMSGTTLNATGGSAVTDPTPPQGRLTLQTGMPVMTTTQSAKTTIFYTPYNGNKIPLYDGASMVMTTFAELSVATTDTTKSPAAIGASKVNDWFVWSDAGTLRLSHGPDWTNDTTRSVGTGLNFINGIWVNFNNITNACNAARGTYVGTTRSNASSQLDWIFATSATVAGWFGVWNCYNRVSVSSLYGKTGTWTYATATWRGWAGGATVPFTAVFGLAEDAIDLSATINVDAPSSGGTAWMGISLDTAGNPTNGLGLSAQIGSVTGRHGLHAKHVSTQLGCHTWYGVEMAAGITFTFRGTADGDGTGITYIARM